MDAAEAQFIILQLGLHVAVYPFLGYFYGSRISFPKFNELSFLIFIEFLLERLITVKSFA